MKIYRNRQIFNYVDDFNILLPITASNVGQKATSI